MDVLSSYPITKPIIKSLRASIKFCSDKSSKLINYKDTPNNSDFYSNELQHSYTTPTTKQRTAHQLNVHKYTDNQQQCDFREENCNRPKHTVINLKQQQASRNTPSYLDVKPDEFELEEMSEYEWEMEPSSDDDHARSRSMEFAFETNHIQVLASGLTDHLAQTRVLAESLARTDFGAEAGALNRDECKQQNESFNSYGKSVFADKLKIAREKILGMLTSIAVSSLRSLNTTTTAITHVIRVLPNTPPLKQKERRIPCKFTWSLMK